MRLEGLERWHVPTIMTLLPFSLQASLVLFCLGLLDFAWNLNQPLAVSLAIIVGSILLFFLSITIGPGFQFLESHQRFGLLTPQCPYKSPQSWAFYKLLGHFWPSFMSTDSSRLSYRTCQTPRTRVYIFMRLDLLASCRRAGMLNIVLAPRILH